jgi:hypothetical protein
MHEFIGCHFSPDLEVQNFTLLFEILLIKAENSASHINLEIYLV